MTGTLIAPVIPSSAAARPARAPAAARNLPLTVPPARPPALPGDVVYGLARVDRSGRGRPDGHRRGAGAAGTC